MPIASRVAHLLALIAVPASLVAQGGGERPARALPREGMVEHEETFSRIKNVLALADGRVVVPDASEKKLMLLDFTNQRASEIARTGSGPREYQTPGGVYRGRGGAAMVYDQQQRRFLPILANGTAGDVVALPTAPTSMVVSDRGPDQFVPDTLGNVVSQRTDARSGQIETRLVGIDARGTEREIAKLASPASRDVGGGSPGVVMRQIVRYSPADIWALAPDGWVAVISASPYRVRWISPTGKTVDGPVIPFTALPVTQADREAARTTNPNRPPASISTSGPGGQRTTPITPPRTEPLFADSKPAFPVQVPGIDGMGRLWIERHVAAGAAPTYDVLDRSGAVVDRIAFPAGTRLAGFGPGVVFAVRTDEDDLLHLQRYRLP